MMIIMMMRQVGWGEFYEMIDLKEERPQRDMLDDVGDNLKEIDDI